MKYFVLIAVAMGLGVLYVYISSPCYQQVETDFQEANPSYAFLDSDAAGGSREKVRCEVSYQKPGSEQILEETWMYIHTKKQGWKFSRILENKEAS